MVQGASRATYTRTVGTSDFDKKKFHNFDVWHKNFERPSENLKPVNKKQFFKLLSGFLHLTFKLLKSINCPFLDMKTFFS
jgi:hypothetical protein